MFKSWLRQQSRTNHLTHKAAPRRGFARPRVEALEDRLAPATAIWTGAGANDLWTNGNNWIRDGVFSVAPEAGDDLVFDEGFLGATTNDFTIGTSFRSITFLAGGYTLNGNLAVLTDGITVGQNGGTTTINLDLALDGNQAVTNIAATSNLTINGVLSLGNSELTLGGEGAITLANSISGSGDARLVKLGTHMAILANNSPSYDGEIHINEGILEVRTSGGLGTTLGHTFLDGGTLQMNGGVTNATIPEVINVMSNGTGFAGHGAIYVISNTIVSGTISLDTDSRITVRNSTMTINGSLTGSGGNIHVNGTGTMLLNTLSNLMGDVTVSGALLQLRENGQMLGMDSFTLNQNGRLLIDNNGTIVLGNRIADTADVNMDAGFLWMRTRSGQFGQETMGDINLVGGYNRINMDATTSATNTRLQLNSTGLNRSAGATLEINRSGIEIGTELNATTFNKIFFNTLNPGLTAANILPYAFVNTSTGGATSSRIVTYGANGIQLRAPTASGSGTALSGTNNAAAVFNVTSNGTISVDTTIGALMFAANAGITLTINAGITLTIAEGVILQATQNDNVTITGASGILLLQQPAGYTDASFFNSSGNNFQLNTRIDGALTDGLNLVDVDNLDGEEIFFGGNVHNTYTGPTRVQAGTLILNKGSNFNAIPGDLIIGDDSGSGTGDGVIVATGNNQIAGGSDVVIRGAGSLTFSTTNNVLDSNLIMQAGRSDGFNNASNGNATITVAGNLRLTQDVSVLAASNDAYPFAGRSIISGGTLILDASEDTTRTFDVEDGAALNDFQIASTLANSTNKSLAKTGAGLLLLTTSNNLNQGDLFVNEGTLIFTGAMNASDVVVGVDGTYGGTGSVSTLDVQGTVSPGWAVGPDGLPGNPTGGTNSPIGTLTVLFGATFQPDSTLLLDVHSVAVFDRLLINNVGLTVDPGAFLTLNLNGFAKAGVVNDIVTYNINTGEFNNLNLIGTTVPQLVAAQTYQATNLDINILEANVQTPSSIIAVAPNKGLNTIEVYDASNTAMALYTITAFGGAGHMEVAVADINGDTYLDIIATQKGRVKIFNGLTGLEFLNDLGTILKPFGGKYKGVLYVAVGDLDNDIGDDLVIGRGSGKSIVKVFSSAASTLTQIASWKAHGNVGGARVAVGNLDGIGDDEIVTATGKKAKSAVRIWDSTGVQLGATISPYGNNKSGVYVSVGNADNTGFDDIVVSSQKSSLTRLVTVYDGEDALASTETVLGTPFLPFASGPIRTAVADLDNDDDYEIAVTQGSTGRLVKFFDVAGTDLAADFSAFDAAFNGGLALGAGTQD